MFLLLYVFDLNVILVHWHVWTLMLTVCLKCGLDSCVLRCLYGWRIGPQQLGDLQTARLLTALPGPPYYLGWVDVILLRVAGNASSSTLKKLTAGKLLFFASAVNFISSSFPFSFTVHVAPQDYAQDPSGPQPTATFPSRCEIVQTSQSNH